MLKVQLKVLQISYIVTLVKILIFNFLHVFFLLFGSFDFVKSVGVEIFAIRLQGGQEATAKVLKHVAGNGPIYIRARQSIERNDEVSYLKVLHLQLLDIHCNKNNLSNTHCLLHVSCCTWR